MPARVALAYAEPLGVALTQQEVDEFMQAEKVVSGSSPMEWVQLGAGGLALWRAPVEIEAARVGEVLCFSSPAVERSWKFILTYRGVEVYRLEAREKQGRHSNPANAPEGFPRKVRAPNHEHVFVEGLECECARPLPELATSDHRAMFQWFCNRTYVRVDPPYAYHTISYQLPLL